MGGIFRPFPGLHAPAAPAFGLFPNVVCVVPNADGNATIEVIGKGQFNVDAEFMDEHIFRRIDIVGSPLSGTTGGNPGTGVGRRAVRPRRRRPPRRRLPTPPSLGGSGQGHAGYATAGRIQARLISAKLITTKSGRKLALRIKSAKKVAKVRIVLKNRKGKVLGTAVRTVRTNRVVMVPNLRIVRGGSSDQRLGPELETGRSSKVEGPPPGGPSIVSEALPDVSVVSADTLH